MSGVSCAGCGVLEQSGLNLELAIHARGMLNKTTHCGHPYAN